MAIAFRAAASAYDNSANALTISKPAGTADGDILLCLLKPTDQDELNIPAITTLSGWTLIATHTNEKGHRWSIFWKRASSEPALYTWQTDLRCSQSGCILAYSGCVASGDPVNVYSNTPYSSNNTTLRAAGVTTSVANAMLVFLGSPDSSTKTGSWSTMTERVDDQGYYGRLLAADVAQETAGASGNKDCTLSASSSAKHAFLVALAPLSTVPVDVDALWGQAAAEAPAAGITTNTALSIRPAESSAEGISARAGGVTNIPMAPSQGAALEGLGGSVATEQLLLALPAEAALEGSLIEAGPMTPVTLSMVPGQAALDGVAGGIYVPARATSPYLKVYGPDLTFVGVVKAKVKWRKKLNGAYALEQVSIPQEYLLADGTTESRVSYIDDGWYVDWDGYRYVVADSDADLETGITFRGIDAAADDLANLQSNYSPGPATWLNRLPSEIEADLLAGRIGRAVRNAGFGILDADGLPTNWTHPTGWTSELVSNRRVWQADAGSDESVSDDRACIPGVSYRVKIDILAAVGESGDVGVKFRFTKADGSTVDSAVTNLSTKDGSFHEVDTGDVVALGVKVQIVLVTDGTSAVAQFDDVRLYEIGPDSGYTVTCSMDTRAAAIPYTDGALEKYGVWAVAEGYIESTNVGDYVGRVVNGPLVGVTFEAGGAGAQAIVRINGVQYEQSGTTLVVGTTAIDVSADLTLTCSGLDPANDHLVEVEVAAVKTRFAQFVVTTANLISMRFDVATLWEALAAVRKAVGGELSYDPINKTVTHAASVGQDLRANNILEFRRGEGGNITKFNEHKVRTQIVNRVTGLGYGEGEYQLMVTVDGTGEEDGKTSVEKYGIRRGTYVNKECKSRAALIAECQQAVAETEFAVKSYTVEVTAAAAALCSPGDVGHFVYKDRDLSLRILEIQRDNESANAALVVGTKAADYFDRVESTRKQLSTLSKAYQGVPTHTNSNFQGQFERTSGGVDTPAECLFFVPYGADLIDLRLRYQISGMRTFAKSALSGGGSTSGSGGATTPTTSSGGGTSTTTGSGGATTPTTSSGGGTSPTTTSVSTPTGGGSTTPSGGGDTSGSTVSDIKTLPSVTRGPALSSTWYEIKINATDRAAEYIYIQIGNFTGGSRSFDYDVRTAAGGGGSSVGSGSLSSMANGDYGSAVVTTTSYNDVQLWARVRMSTAGDGNYLFTATRYGFSGHTHTTPAHTHSTPDHAHPAHSHSVTVPDHSHSVTIGDHSHSVTIGDHTHSTPNHTHSLDFGILESSVPGTVRVYLDDVLIADLNDLTYVSDFDLLPFIAKDSNGRVQEGYHVLEFRSASAGATGSVQGLLFDRQFLSTEAA